MRAGIIGLGAGGHAKGVIEIVRLAHAQPLAGLLDPRRDLWGKDVLGVPVLGDDHLIEQLLAADVGYFFVGVGGASDTRPRQRLYEWAIAHGLSPITAIHPRAIVSGEAKIGPGVQIFAGAIVNAGAILETHATVNTGAIVEHDCLIGPHAHVASGARLAGGVTVGLGAHIGAGATVRENIVIGERAVVGAGAVVVSHVPSHTTVVGVPAKPLRGHA